MACDSEESKRINVDSIDIASQLKKLIFYRAVGTLGSKTLHATKQECMNFVQSVQKC